MKRTLCTVLALILALGGFVFPTAAAEPGAQTVKTTEGIDILATDSETLSGWQSYSGEGLPAAVLTAMPGHGNAVTYTSAGMMYAGGGWAHPNGSGSKPTNGFKLAYLSPTAYDVSSMKYFVFDVYVSHPDKISGVEFYVELSSKGKNDAEEDSICKTLAAMKGEPIVAGWNRIYLSLDSMDKGTGSDAGKPAMNTAKWNFVRFYNQTAFNAGTEFVLAFDNVGFAVSKPETDLETFTTTFRTFTDAETPYHVSGGSKDGSNRYVDRTAKIVYCYPVEQLARAERITWTAGVANQFHLEVSLDGIHYTNIYKYNCDLDELIASGDNHGNAALKGWQLKGLSAANMTFDLTETVKALANEASDKLYIRVGDSYPYAIIKNEDGTYTEDTAGTSGIQAGSGGKIMSNADVTLSVSYPWGVIKPTVTDTVTFSANTPDEKAYIYGSAASFSKYNVRFADGLAYFCYAYPVSDIQKALSVKWQAYTGGQLLLDVSTDFQSWTEIYRFTAPVADMVANPGKTKAGGYETYDITAAILKTASSATDKIYIRVRDAYPYVLNADGTESTTLNGAGGSVSAGRPVVLTVEYEVDATEQTTTRDESVTYRFLPTTSTAKTGVTHANIGTITTGSEYPYIVTEHYTGKDVCSRMYSNNRYYYNDGIKHLLYAFPLEEGATVLSGSFSAMMGAELSLSISDSPNGPFYEAEVRTADEIASGVAKDADLANIYRTVDLTAAMEQLGTIEGDKLYVRIGDSDTSDGVGGRVWGDKAAEFTCEYRVSDTAAAQTALGRGTSYSFTATTATEKTSTVHTNIGTVTTGEEYPYMVTSQYAADGSDKAYMHSNNTFYFCDGTKYLMYAFPIEDGATLNMATFSAKMGVQLLVAVSDSPAGPWREVEARTAAEIAAGTAVTAKLANQNRTLDLTAAVRQIGEFKNDMIYIRISDSDPTNGNGAQVHGAAVTFTYTGFVHAENKNADDALKFKSGALTLTDDFGINYTISAPETYTGLDLRVGFSPDKMYKVTPNGVGSTLTFRFDDISAQRLGDKVYTTLIADCGGTPAVVHKTYSVREYCERMLAKSTDATFKTLISDVLCYGAEAQKYASYRTDELVTDGLTLTPSTFNLAAISGGRGTEGTRSEQLDWYSASLTLDSSMKINMTFKATSLKNLRIGVQIGDNIEDMIGEFTVLGDGYYRISYDIMSHEFFDTLSAKFYVDGVETGRTLKYSVGGYINSTYASAPATRKALLATIANYGASVAAYVAENPELMGAPRNEENVIYSPKTSYLTANEYARAVALNDSNTNLTLLQNVMNRAKAGEDITVATIGGSITAGSSSSDYTTKSYSAHFRDWWITTFPESNVTHVNAGIGATTSHLGVHRVDAHVLDYEPDVCIVEFAVNDYAEPLYAKTYESLVAKLLDQGVAVILQFMVKETGGSEQAVHAAIGAKYNLPMLSYGDAIFPTITAGQRTWADISPDNIHPNDYGHAYMGEILWKYLNSVYAYTPNEVTVRGYDSTALKATPYYNAKLLGPVEKDDTTAITPVDYGMFKVVPDSSQSKMVGSWVADASLSSENVNEMTFKMSFDKLGIMYTRTIDGLSGICDVYVDGVKVAELNGDFSGGWGNYQTTVGLCDFDTVAEHTVTFKMRDPSKQFILVRLMAAN